MIEFFNALGDPNIPFLRYAFIAGVLASVSFGVIGTYVIARRISYIAGAISHCVLGGIGLGLYLQKKVGLIWFSPVHGALIVALFAALIIGVVSIYARQREDTVIGALWATGMALGLLFLAKTPGYTDPMSYLFGNILLISRDDLWLITGLDILVGVFSIIFYNKLLAVCFDEEFSKTRGIRAGLYYLLLLCLTAVTVVILMRIVGMVLVIALLTLPVAIAGHFSRRLWQMMIFAIVFCALFTSAGLGYSYTYNLPSGPVIIVFSGIAYLLVVCGSYIFRKYFSHKHSLSQRLLKRMHYIIRDRIK